MLCEMTAGMSIRDAARLCGVAKSTLADRFRGKSSTRGRPRTFNQEEEEILVDLLIRCSEIGIVAPSTA